MGRYHWSQWTEEGFRKSIQRFLKVTELNPDRVLAYADLSDAYNAIAYHGFVSPLGVMPQAKAAAEHALQRLFRTTTQAD